MNIRKTVNPGELLPAWYGVAWIDYMRNQAVCYPVPLNLLAALVRCVYMFAKHGARWLSHDPRGAYHPGFEAGRASAHAVIVNQVVGDVVGPELFVPRGHVPPRPMPPSAS